MIAKSDLIILTVSASALAVGVYRWQQTVQAPNVAAAPPPPIERVVETAAVEPPAAVAEPSATVTGDVASGGAAEDGAVVVRRVSVGGTSGDGGERAAANVPADVAPDESELAGGTDALAGASGGGGEALYGRYRIRDGDYLGKLANRFGTSVRALQSINELDGTTIHVGDELLYPLPAN